MKGKSIADYFNGNQKINQASAETLERDGVPINTEEIDPYSREIEAINQHLIKPHDSLASLNMNDAVNIFKGID